ncbi:MAG: hypothetical protein VCD34_05305, partial [Planctomycetota bacterium]
MGITLDELKAAAKDEGFEASRSAVAGLLCGPRAKSRGYKCLVKARPIKVENSFREPNVRGHWSSSKVK